MTMAIRYLIHLPKKTPARTTGKSLQDIRKALEPTIQKLLTQESGDRDKAELLYISVVEQGPSKGLLVVIDYDNPTHCECRVSGFRIRGSKIRPISVPARTVHQRIRNCRAFPTLASTTHPCATSSTDRNVDKLTIRSKCPSGFPKTRRKQRVSGTGQK